jgi:Zn-dependent metalloprotease
MCSHRSKLNHIHCIIPPYMALKLISSDQDRADYLRSTLINFSIDEELRGRRQAFSKVSSIEKIILANEQFHDLNGNKATLLGLHATVPGAVPSVNREVYDAQHKPLQPGKLARKEGDPAVSDLDINQVYDYAGAIWDFYYSLFGRNSIDNAGMKLIQTVNYQKNYQNAFWDGKQMIYGDGDGKIFASFTSDLDVAGHELTHGVVQYECNLAYMDQSGALNESLADVFGLMIKQKFLNEDVNASNWLIGENILIGEEYAIRSFKAPGTAYVNHPVLGTDPQPNHMNGYYSDPNDNGGVHLNSGITNHAFYLAAVAAGGFSWETVGPVWYKAMCNKTLVPINATFADFKEATITEATALYGATNKITQAIEAAWNTVGV